MRGTLDSATDHDRLVLRSGAAGFTMQRTIPWDRIASLAEGGESTEPAVLRQRVPPSPTGCDALLPTRPARPTLTMQTLTAGEMAAAEPHHSRPQRVTSIATDPRIANWDADVEIDGLIVDIAPFDADGQLVAAQAVAEVELFAPQRRDFSLAPMSGGDTLELVERWVQRIEPDHYSAYGARLRLPFGAIHPELHPEWTASWYGLVHVRLVVPGQGVFTDSRDGVRIRPWAPNRDRLELKDGRRFLPTERLGRTD